MKNRSEPPIYSQIAVDIAIKIAKGELQENRKITGRSLLVSEYNTSSETIRRALSILDEMEIVKVMHNSGAIILSREKAAQYVEKYNLGKDIRTLKNEVKEQLAARSRADLEISEKIDRIFDLSERLRSTNHFYTLEFEINRESAIIGKTISQTQFRQKTGATVVAIKRNSKMILSPLPDETFQLGDIILVVGTADVTNKINHLIQEGD